MWRKINVPKAEQDAWVREFRKRARFLIDEDVPPQLAAILTRHGYNSKSVSEIGLRGRSDEEVLSHAFRDDRILITNDDGFRDERRFPEHRNPGVVIIPNGALDDDGVVTAIEFMLPVVGKHRALFTGCVVQVARDGTLSVTSRDHDSGARTTSRFKYGNDGEYVWEPD